MSISAPNVQLDEVLSTVEFSNSVYIAGEEKLRVRSAAISKSQSQLTFLVRQPAPQAILENCPRLELALRYKYEKIAGGNIEAAHRSHVKRAAADTCYGCMPEGFPFMAKCVKTASCTQNGATTTYRPSATFKDYLQACTNRSFMERNGTPWNDYQDQKVVAGNDFAANVKNVKVISRSESMQHDMFREQAMGEDSKEWEMLEDGITRTFYYQEPLYFGVYGGIRKNGSFPEWCSSRNISPSLLHQDSTSLDLALVDNWPKLMAPLIGQENGALKLKSVEILEANIVMDFWSPPPRFTASALSMTSSYQCALKTLRYTIDPVNNVTQLAKYGDGATSYGDFKIGNCSFPQMPNAFIWKMQKSYQHALNKVGSDPRDQAVCRASKMDVCPMIYGLVLQINTSSNCWPSSGSDAPTQANCHNFRFSALELYKYYKKNTSYTDCLYDFESWKKNCTVILTPQDLNGILQSPSIQGLCTVSCTVSVLNTMNYKCYVGNGSPPAANDHHFCDADGNNQPLEKFEMALCAHYSNQYLTFDAKSAVLGSQTLSASFGSGLRLS